MRTTPVALTAVALTLAVACGGNSSSTSGSTGSVDRGGTLFANTCAQCHGAALEGTVTGPPLIHDFYVPSHHSDASFRLAATRGVQQHHWEFGDMPPVPSLSTQDIEDIIAFVRDAQRQAGLIE